MTEESEEEEDEAPPVRDASLRHAASNLQRTLRAARRGGLGALPAAVLHGAYVDLIRSRDPARVDAIEHLVACGVPVRFRGAAFEPLTLTAARHARAADVFHVLLALVDSGLSLDELGARGESARTHLREANPSLWTALVDRLGLP